MENAVKYFTKVGSDLARNLSSERNFNKYRTISRNQHSIFLEPISANEIKKLIAGLSPHKCAGPDNVSISDVKKYRDIFAQILSRIYNTVLSNGEYPSCLKVSRVNPVFKGEDPQEISNLHNFGVQ